MRAAVAASVLAAIAGLAGRAEAQYSLNATPYRSVGHSFYESIGVGWGLRFGGPGGPFFNFNQGGPVAPQFGGFDPNAGLQGGFGFRSGNLSGRLNFFAGQGSNTTLTSQTPMVAVPNGGIGFFSDTTQRPFVTGLIPVVGGEPVSPLQEKLHRLQTERPTASADEPAPAAAPTPRAPSTAEHGDLSVAEIKARQAAAREAEAAAQSAELDALVEKARGLEAAGKANVARIYYQQALRRATGSRRAELEARLAELK